MDFSSPVGATGSPMEGFLTPRSKVAKLLADIDNASTPSPPLLQTSKALDEDTSRELPAEPSFPITSEKTHGQPQLDSDDSDAVVRKPQGRAARRMLGAHGSSTQSSPRQRHDVQSDEDDLCSATPMRRTKPSKAHSISPVGSDQGNGLFVSPTKSVQEDSDGDLPAHPLGSKEKLAELVAQKRTERLAKEAEEKKNRRLHAHASSDLPDQAFEHANDAPPDPEIEKIMSDANKPARKASKKALLDMERETQRLSRQQALAHQMKVKKKFTTNDLFAKFNFRQANAANETSNNHTAEGDTTASSAPNSDGIEEHGNVPKSTPPSTPPTPLDKQRELVEKGALSKMVPVRQDSIASLVEFDEDEELPDMEEVMRRSQMPKTMDLPAAAQFRQNLDGRKGLKVARLGKMAAIPWDEGSDDELEVIQQLPAHLSVFDKAIGSTRPGRPADSKAIHNLKHLSHIHANEAAPLKKGTRPSINPKALESQLRRRAKEQARQQQLERIEELQAKGIEVQTTEEREKEAEAFEDLLEKARQDAVALRKAEKAALKEATGNCAVEASDDEDEDEDYVGSEEEDEDGETGDEKPERAENGLIDEAAEETDEEEEEIEVSDDELGADETAEQDVDEDTIAPPDEDVQGQSEHANDDSNTAPRKFRKSHIVMDDEDEEQAEEEDSSAGANEQQDDEDPFAAFNFGGANNDLLLSPTQAFNATMQTPTQATQEDSFDILRRIAPPSASSLPPSLPDFDTQIDDETEMSFVAGSQVPESQQINLNWETQPPETPVPAGLNRGPSALSETPGWEPTQDPGLPSPWSEVPKMRRASTVHSLADHDTQSTVRLRVSESPAPSQTAPKRGRLRHRRVPLIDDSDDELAAPVSSVKPEKRDAFREMAKRRKDALTATERAEAEKEMRQMMDEQAEESEDEYAGLGGDDFVAPETEQDREMIDSSQIDVDERAIAAHFAERQRQRDEAETSKLYKDLTTGVLRRKMGANTFDLDEDEDELAVRRRQMRQREEAKKRRALLKDENIATLAEGRQSKGKDAFLKAIADDDGDEEVVDISDEEGGSVPATQEESTQSQAEQPAAAPLRETSGNKRKMADDDDGAEGRLPAKQRRTQVSAFKRPTSLLEVKDSVSFLLEEPNAGAPSGPSVLELSSDTENEEQDKERSDEDDEDDELAAEEARANDGGFAPNPISMEAKAMPPPRLPASQRRTAAEPAVIDRLSMKRGSSGSNSALGRTAWAAGPATGGFKVPSLLRRATTSMATSGNDRGVTTPSMSREGSGVKMGGSKKSSLAYQARAEERRAIVEASAKRREENTKKIALLRRNSSALSRGLTGRFE